MDFCAVDPCFGDLAAFDRLVAAAHARSLRVILDFVPNHTSDRHPWFAESRASCESPRRDWYVWRDGCDGGPPNGWRSMLDAPAWTHDPATGRWYYHAFLPEQPDLNWRNPAVVAAMDDVLRFGLERGVDGFRVDAVAHSSRTTCCARTYRLNSTPRACPFRPARATPSHQIDPRRTRRSLDGAGSSTPTRSGC